FNQGASFRHGFLYRLEKRPAQKKIEKQNDYHGGHSIEKQFPKLVEDIHRKKNGSEAALLIIRIDCRRAVFTTGIHSPSEADDYRIGLFTRQRLPLRGSRRSPNGFAGWLQSAYFV
ncbi:MAG: hypothetical protein WA175_13980, partial [Candidatus Acidiferrales bacterium]